MDTVISWAGLIIIATLALFSMRIFWLMVVAALAACSVLRWRIAMCRAHCRTIHWRHAPSLLFKVWIDFVPYEKGRITMHDSGGRWNGIGDWYVFPSSQNAELSRRHEAPVK